MDSIQELYDWMMTVENDEESGMDRFDILEKILPVMRDSARNILCAMLEVCPIHVVDIQICADDDEQECKQYWR